MKSGSTVAGRTVGQQDSQSLSTEMVHKQEMTIYPLAVTHPSSNSTLPHCTVGPRAKTTLRVASDLHSDVVLILKQYKSPSILQPFILRPPLIIRPLDSVPNDKFLY